MNFLMYRLERSDALGREGNKEHVKMLLANRVYKQMTDHFTWSNLFIDIRKHNIFKAFISEQ